MSKHRDLPQTILYIFAVAVFPLTWLVSSLWGPLAAIVFFELCLGMYMGFQVGLWHIRSEMKLREKLLKNPLPPGRTVDLSLYWKNTLLISGPEPFTIPAPAATDSAAEEDYERLELGRLGSTRLVSRTKPVRRDFEEVYFWARDKGFSDLHFVYDEWRKRYPERVKDLQDPWGSFKHGMETQEKNHGAFFSK